jgi:hypothetical protein
VFPAAGRAVLKARVSAIALALADDFRRDADLFLECARDPEIGAGRVADVTPTLPASAPESVHRLRRRL